MPKGLKSAHSCRFRLRRTSQPTLKHPHITNASQYRIKTADPEKNSLKIRTASMDGVFKEFLRDGWRWCPAKQTYERNPRQSQRIFHSS